MANKFRIRSIRKKLFFQALIGVAVFVLIAIILNTVVLKPFYISQKKNIMLSVLDELADIDLESEDSQDIINTISAIESEHDITIYWITGEGEVIYLSNLRFLNGLGYGGGMNGLLNPNQLDRGMLLKNLDVLTNVIYDDSVTRIFNIAENTRSNVNNYQNSEMVLLSTFEDLSEISLRYRLQSFSDAIGLFNLFLLGAAIISIIISILLSLFMARRFTEPIFRMNESAKAIAGNDFSKMCVVNTGDELEQLAVSINSINTSLKVSICDLKDANIKLGEELEKHKRLDKLRQRFVSTVSHELRTPISLIQGYSYGLKSNITKDSKKREFYTDTIIDESQRMSDLVDDLLDLSQMESGYLKLNIVEFNAFDWLQEIGRKYDYLSRSRGKHLNLENMADIDVKGDKKRLEQVFGNFLTNAIRHSETKEILIKSKDVGSAIEIGIANVGSILSSEEQKNIWQNFYRVDDDRSRIGGGHGLGLAIVKNIQEGHEQGYGCRATRDGMEFWFRIVKV